MSKDLLIICLYETPVDWKAIEMNHLYMYLSSYIIDNVHGFVSKDDGNASLVYMMAKLAKKTPPHLRPDPYVSL